MRVLGIETSCDETAVAIVDCDKHIHANLVASQIDIHRITGGVVPEVAARAHLDALQPLVKQALQDAQCGWDDIDGIAATCGPGLIGGVMVGMMTAKSLASALGKPFFAINHLEGHALTPRLTSDLPYPYLLLLVSGGHTQILAVKGLGDYVLYGTTLDDAAGECFDKAAKAMGLPYPGGPEIEKMAREYDGKPAAAHIAFPLPKPLCNQQGCDFSFSGLKTAVIRHIEAVQEADYTRDNLAPLAFALQDRIADVMCDRLQNAFERFKQEMGHVPLHCVVSGGVAANQYIRGRLEDLCSGHGFIFAAPPMKLCTDNAAMIAWAGVERLQAGQVSGLDFKARPRWPLEELRVSA
tara:strand:+ start:363 stop:1421 length:1059 start_codon:yes stop_codon:yes gene_type:complete